MTAIADRSVGRVRPMRSAGGTVAAYVSLTKPKLVELLLVTTLPAMMLAAGGWPGTGLVVATLVGGMLAAGAANTINCWYDRDIDRLMSRTRDRPIPSGVIAPRNALVFGVLLAWVSLVVLGLFTTPLATVLAAAAVLAYSVLYTMVLKRRTRHNTVFGGLPGAAPVLIGWAAVTGSLDWPAVVFFGIVFCWQMPHFWALASRFRFDYFRAGVPMLSVVAGPVTVGRQSVAWAWGTLGTSLLMVPVTPQLGWVTGIATLGLGAWYVAESHAWLRRIKGSVPDRPMRLFSVSITYMTLLSIALVADVLL
ncbi:heme o synthase [Modestobacter sp. VKM Ac-2985]|uniref:heme o synthase n=1 Tax=Modestobacter sp. VKM Ac-2985 TaxID=3004139 RepID=UPI0022ABADDD|nr:heme o synthase [Modestobacter sp. VKM Ac-2985]MCZ2839668.1 heme o synthase [Modestobacter sp. VKM Ac-2985]